MFNILIIIMFKLVTDILAVCLDIKVKSRLTVELDSGAGLSLKSRLTVILTGYSSINSSMDFLQLFQISNLTFLKSLLTVIL